MAITKKKKAAPAARRPKAVPVAKPLAAPAVTTTPKKANKAWMVVLLLIAVLGGLVLQTVVMARRKAAMTWDMMTVGAIVPKGQGDGEGLGAISLMGDKADNLYFLEGLSTDKPRLQKFDPRGHFITKYEGKTPEQLIPAPRGIYVAEDGSCAVVLRDGKVKVLDKDLKFKFGFDAKGLASGICQDIKGNWLVSLDQENKIVVFDAKGKLLSEFGAPGANTGDLAAPSRLLSTRDGEILVLELVATGPRVKVLSPDYKVLRTFMVSEIAWNEASAMGVNAEKLLFMNDQASDKSIVVYDIEKGKYKGNTKGTQDGQVFISPGAVGGNKWTGSVYVGTVTGTIKCIMPTKGDK